MTDILYSQDNQIIAFQPNILYADDHVVVLWIAQWEERLDYLRMEPPHEVKLNEDTLQVHQWYADVWGIDVPRLQDLCQRGRYYLGDTLDIDPFAKEVAGGSIPIAIVFVLRRKPVETLRFHKENS